MRPRPSLLLTALLAGLVLLTSGCGFTTITSSSSSGGGDLVATDLAPDVVARLGLDGVGTGPVSWWTRGDDPSLHPDVEPVGWFEPLTDVASIEILHVGATLAGDAAPRDVAPETEEVVLRPAWRTRLDERSQNPSTLGWTEEVTVSFMTPGAPGQYPDDENLPRVTSTGEVEAAAGTCVDVVGLQAWQAGPPDRDEGLGALQVEYLGSITVRMPCD